MCAVWIAAIFTCRLPTDPDCSCPAPTELMASLLPEITPDGSWREEIMLPSSMSAAVPSVTDVYFLVRQS